MRKSARGGALGSTGSSSFGRTFTMSVFGADTAPRASVTTRLTWYSPGVV
jgi:hypothetical protein